MKKQLLMSSSSSISSVVFRVRSKHTNHSVLSSTTTTLPLYYHHLSLNERKQVVLKDEKHQHTIQVNFLDKSLQYKVNHTFNSKSALIKAVSIKQKPKNETVVLDATTGLGKDAYIISTFGFQMIWIERNPLLYELLKDGYERCMEQYSSGTLDDQIEQQKKQQQHKYLYCQTVQQILNMDARDYRSDSSVDVVYLDPMFTSESIHKKATPKKEMQTLRSLLHDTNLSEIEQQRIEERELDQLVTWALSVATSKVILKRPKTAPKHPLVSHSYAESDNIRYDAILPPSKVSDAIVSDESQDRTESTTNIV
jgi:16S rRNA (guanine1516-N2)-methyltransferase